MRICTTATLILTFLLGGLQSVAAANPEGVPESAEVAYVTGVVDGDTIYVALDDGTQESVRLIGIDTPETVDPNQPDGCYGKEASERVEKLIKPGRMVWLESDQTDRDRYDRLLRYVWVQKSNGDVYLLNEVLVRDGFAIAKRYEPDTKRAAQLERAQEKAIAKEKGMWGACPGLLEAFTETVEVDYSEVIGLASGGNCDPSYPSLCIPIGAPDLDCGDIADRRFPVLPPDPMRFDGNSDGVGCEGA